MAATWRLALTFWVGGLWLLHFVVLPSLERFGLASLLVEDVARGLRPLLMGFAAFCAILQGALLHFARDVARPLRDSRGQLLLVCLVSVAAYFALRHWAPEIEYGLRFAYLVTAFAGALLVMRRAPGGHA
ncbi:DUF4149 domain-containing protein [Pseudomonas sp. RIT-PI-AD]|uniref:DUF4149 domain-containing protein n=1 Tax=Pseudomonas sp. RIT-PI-AD TaxID=3035294 RepID=UPI0021D863C5|nr:DUF4149 domain-containing protein [Pseudomonas sp. RIT-PI-AD]